jgi:hypothetical protein
VRHLSHCRDCGRALATVPEPWLCEVCAGGIGPPEPVAAPVVALVGEGGALRLRLLEPLGDRPDGLAEATAIRAVVELEAGRFRGGFETVVWSFDLAVLRRALAALGRDAGDPDRARAVECTFTEQDLAVAAERADGGAIEVKVRATPEPSDRPADQLDLTFTLSGGPADLAEWLSSLDAALAWFHRAEHYRRRRTAPRARAATASAST